MNVTLTVAIVTDKLFGNSFQNTKFKNSQHNVDKNLNIETCTYIL